MKYIFSVLLATTLLIITVGYIIQYADDSISVISRTFEPVSKSSDKIHNNFVESSPFMWKNKLKYLLSERDDKKKFYNLAIYDFETRKKEITISEGYGLASATVIDDVLYVTATKNWFTFGKSEVYLFVSDDLKTFSVPKLILQAEENQKIINTSLSKNTQNNKLVLVYEFEDTNMKPFSFSFLTSEDGKIWIKNDELVFGKEVYVGCPSIKYIDNYYYLFFMTNEFYDPNCITCISYVTKVARSIDLKNWQTSQQNFLFPDLDSEGSNNSDVDLVEYKNGTIVFYAIGDQVKAGGIKYAFSKLPIDKLVSQYFY